MLKLIGSSQMLACLDLGHHTKALSEACLFTFLRSSLSTLLDGMAPVCLLLQGQCLCEVCLITHSFLYAMILSMIQQV